MTDSRITEYVAAVAGLSRLHHVHKDPPVCPSCLFGQHEDMVITKVFACSCPCHLLEVK